jgi:hypothetical protein
LQTLLAHPNAVSEGAGGNGDFYAGLHILRPSESDALVIIEKIAGADGERARHQESGSGNMALAVRLAGPPATLEYRLAFLVDLPAHFAKCVDTVCRLVDREPVLRPLRQDSVHVFLFLDHGRLEFADAGQIEVLSLVQDNGLLAIMTVRMVRALMDVPMACNNGEIQRVGPERRDVLRLQEPVRRGRVVRSLGPLWRILHGAKRDAAAVHGPGGCLDRTPLLRLRRSLNRARHERTK